MASSREQLIYLITEKTDMDEAQAISYISEVTKDLDRTSIEAFFKDMVRTLGEESAQKLDGVALNVIVNDVKALNNVKTQSVVQEEKEAAKQDKAKREEEINANINRAKEVIKKQKEPVVEDNSINEIETDVDDLNTFLPKDWQKGDLTRMISNMQEFKEKYGLDEKIAYTVASTIEKYNAYDDVCDEIDRRYPPEEASKKKSSAWLACRMEDLDEETKSDPEAMRAITEAGKMGQKWYEKVREEIRREEAANEPINSRETKKNIGIIQIEIRTLEREKSNLEAVLQRNPNNEIARNRIDFLNGRISELQTSIKAMENETHRDENTSKKNRDTIDCPNGVRIEKTSFRRQAIDIQIQHISAKIEEKKQQLLAAKKPRKRALIAADLTKLGNELNKLRNDSQFEAAYGTKLDEYFEDNKDGIITPFDKKKFEVKFKDLMYEKKSKEFKESIAKLRERLNDPTITQEEKMMIMNQMYTTESSAVQFDFKTLGTDPSDAYQNLKNERIPILSVTEMYETEKANIEASSVDNKIKTNQLNALELRMQRASDFSSCLDDLAKKGYSGKEIYDFIRMFSEIKTNNHLKAEITNNQIGLKEAFGLIMPQNEYNVPDNLIEDFWNYYEKDGKMGSIKGLFSGVSPIYEKAILNEKEKYEKTMDYDDKDEKKEFKKSLENLSKGTSISSMKMAMTMMRIQMQSREENPNIGIDDIDNETPDI